MSTIPTLPPGGLRASSSEDPETANQLAQQILGDPASPPDTDAPTLIQRPPTGEVELPGGLLEPDGGVILDAEVREMTGADEEAIAKTDAATNLGRFMQVILQRCVTRIGKYEPPDKGVLGQLLLGDRDMLVLGVRAATYGTDLEMSTICAFCEEVLDVVIDLDNDIEIKKLEDREQRRYKVKLRNGEATVRLPIGEDQDAIYAKPNLSTPEANTLLLSRCVLEINGSPLFGSAQAAVRNMGSGDRRTVLHFLTDTQPGPRYEGVKVNCASCEREVTLNIRLVDLFRN